jgi:hypothetical protein
MKRTRELIKASSLFSFYKDKLKPPQASIEKVFIEVVEEVMGITLKTDWVIFTPYTKTISLHCPAVIKQEIKRHEKELLAHCRGRMGGGAPSVIL